MKKYRILLVMFLITAGNLYAQPDSLRVYLEKNKEYEFGVDLVFDNNFCDTVSVIVNRSMPDIDIYKEYRPARRRILKLSNSNSRSGRYVLTFICDNADINAGYELIAPGSQFKLFFDLSEYYTFPESAADKYEVIFNIPFYYAVYRDWEVGYRVPHFRTNSVTILEPNENRKGK